MGTDHSSRNDEVIDHAALFKRLAGGLQLVTANSRLARVLRIQYNQWRLDRGDRQWESPAVKAWGHWLNALWEQAGLLGVDGTDRAVPGQQQLLSLWQSVLRSDAGANTLLRPESLAAQLRDTRRTAVEWHLDLADRAWQGEENENHEAFRRWNLAFEALCRERGWVPPEDRYGLLAHAYDEGWKYSPGDFGLLGFDEFSPAQARLVAALQRAGATATTLSLEPAGSMAVLWQAVDAASEVQAMARWVRHRYENEPDARIAVAVPDLQNNRRAIERSLREVLTPGQAPRGSQVPWNLSLGQPLSRVPLVESAFSLLRLLDQPVDIQDVGNVLRSPWIRGGNEERDQRALLEKCLRENYPRRFRLAEVRYRATEIRKHDRDRGELPEDEWEPQPWNSPGFARAVSALLNFAEDGRAKRPASGWAEDFDRLLGQLGWPEAADADMVAADRHGESEAWQAHQSWQEALRELASLDATNPQMSRQLAISSLHQICRERIFQARTPPARIQVLGLYEASGLRFDHLWVLGLHHGNWPPAAAPDPFIPAQLQRDGGLPHSSPQRELDVALTVTQRLLETAENTVFSFPGQLDGEATLPSPLLRQLETVKQLPAWEEADWATTVSRAGGLQTGPLAMPGVLTADTARGGSSILKNQALCPFRAFATNRLGASGLETPVDGISGKLHGSLVHRVLEHFWQETVSQQALLDMSGEQTQQRLRKHIERVIDEERGLMFREAFRQVEADRLLRQSLACLELEKLRDPFEVEGFEVEIVPEIEGQPVRLYIDRVDRLASGQQAIIDYKTGKVDPRKWFGDRPEDPQLPLYAISAANLPAAVVFSIIRDDGCLYKGVVCEGDLFPDLPPRRMKTTEYLVAAGEDLAGTVANWRQVLHRLMADFLAGEAAIDPKKGRETCRSSYCDLQSLCRLGELEALHEPAAAGTEDCP
jgi:probable DNA repair protein